MTMRIRVIRRRMRRTPLLEIEVFVQPAKRSNDAVRAVPHGFAGRLHPGFWKDVVPLNQRTQGMPGRRPRPCPACKIEAGGNYRGSPESAARPALLAAPLHHARAAVRAGVCA